MCGIAGFADPLHPVEHLLRSASNLIAHRGPDDMGLFVGEGIGLATRRLSIIDLGGGHQPLSNEDGSLWIAYNGEIFNAPELRETLIHRGHLFKTHTDTEVVVHAYEEWGLDALPLFRGMYAFALWDGSRERLLLVRDRFGIKPLHYVQSSGRLAFASEIRPLFTLEPALAVEPDYIALGYLFQYGYIPTPLTAFAHIRQLPAAHYLSYQNGSIEIQRYWELGFPAEGSHAKISEQEASEGFLHHLRDAVVAWRMSDVPVASLLSGGIDSASLAALLTEISGGIHTFTIRFSEASYDESGQARAIANHIGSTHHELDFSMSSFDHLPDIVTSLESPQCSATSIPISLLYRACHEAGFKVIMTGEGADELLGGYHWFEGDRRARALLALPRGIRTLLAGSPLPMSSAARRVLREGDWDPTERYALWTKISDEAERLSLMNFPAPDRYPPDFLALKPRLKGRHSLDQFLILDANTRMVDFINFEVDRMSMMHSVEARPPFLDHLLWEFTAKLPPDLKLSSSHNKRLLRLAMQAHLPPQTIRQRKKGLAAPHAAWWRKPSLPAWAEECLSSSALEQTGFFHIDTVARLREMHQRGGADHSRLLTGVLTTQLWYDRMRVTIP
ncbi:MAG: asparagine synthase (glutamine-hydrolyzing) [Anaerolineales bacterium]